MSTHDYRTQIRAFDFPLMFGELHVADDADTTIEALEWAASLDDQDAPIIKMVVSGEEIRPGRVRGACYLAMRQWQENEKRRARMERVRAGRVERAEQMNAEKARQREEKRLATMRRIRADTETIFEEILTILDAWDDLHVDEIDRPIGRLGSLVTRLKYQRAQKSKTEE